MTSINFILGNYCYASGSHDASALFHLIMIITVLIVMIIIKRSTATRFLLATFNQMVPMRPEIVPFRTVTNTIALLIHEIISRLTMICRNLYTLIRSFTGSIYTLIEIVGVNLSPIIPFKYLK